MFKPYPKDSTGLEVPNLEMVSVKKLDNDVKSSVTSSIYKSTFQVELQTDMVAQYVWLEALGKILTYFFATLEDTHYGTFINANICRS